MIATSKGGYKNSATTYGRGVDYGRGSYGDDILLKFLVIVEEQDISLILTIESMTFHPHFKFKNKNHDHSHTNAVFYNTNFNNDEQNHKG